MKSKTDMITKFLTPIVKKTSEELYKQLLVNVVYMNINLRDLFDMTHDYDSFWSIINSNCEDYYSQFEDIERSDK